MPKKDAIHEDVSDEIEEEKEEVVEEEIPEEEKDDKPIHPRDAVIQGILARRKEELEGEIEGDKEVKEEDKDEDDEGKENNQDDLLTAKVNGEEEKLTKEELEKQLAEYQKHKAADIRLQEASVMIKNAEAEQKRLKELEESLKVKINTKEDGEDEEDKSSTNEINIEEIVAAIRDGNDDEAKDAMDKLVKGIKPTTPNVESIVAEAIHKEREKQAEEDKEKLAEARKVEIVKAEEKFNETFVNEIKSNDDFFDAAILQDALLDKDPEWTNRSFKDRFEEAGNRAKKLLGLDKNLREEKKEKKKKISNLKSATARDKIGEDKKPPTRSDSIAWIAKQRGQRLVG